MSEETVTVQHDTSELDKVQKFRTKIVFLKEFMEWLGDQGYILASYTMHPKRSDQLRSDEECWNSIDCDQVYEHRASLLPVPRQYNKYDLVYEFLDIDRKLYDKQLEEVYRVAVQHTNKFQEEFNG